MSRNQDVIWIRLTLFIFSLNSWRYCLSFKVILLTMKWSQVVTLESVPCGQRNSLGFCLSRLEQPIVVSGAIIYIIYDSDVNSFKFD